MSISEAFTAISVVVTILGSAVSFGVWVGLRRAESKRIVKVEEGLRKIQTEMQRLKEQIHEDQEDFIREADNKYANKEVIGLKLENILAKQKEIAEDVKDIKKVVKP